ncbi:MAG: 2-C-methyl-D-erythritol 2,4-cyclodiphosphate synthase [Bacilli bacterium]|nr:2-C-methyl-D-erythritol 2,4-cyclodiphosphate synthase [Bacilli bacterium]
MLRIGYSSDIHKLVKNRPLILGGVKINFSKGEEAFSDGDVLIHAISEAILGALALGDLGRHFPNSKENKNINSVKILNFVCKKMADKKYSINNIDASIFLEKPNLSTYILKIRRNLSKLINISVEQISVKACTNEGFDSVGKGQSIVVSAIVLLTKNKND